MPRDEKSYLYSEAFAMIAALVDSATDVVAQSYLVSAYELLERAGATVDSPMVPADVSIRRRTTDLRRVHVLLTELLACPDVDEADIRLCMWFVDKAESLWVDPPAAAESHSGGFFHIRRRKADLADPAPPEPLASRAGDVSGP